MTVSFRVGRYLLALLWHWSIPFVLGSAFASVLALQGVQEGMELLEDALDASISRVAESCSARTLEPSHPLITRFSASAEFRQVYAVVGPEGKERQAVGDSPKGARASPWPLLGTNVPCDGASSCAVRPASSVGVARSARGNPCQALHECAKAKVHLILRDSLAYQNNNLIK
jgi:hypothetical protein